MSPLESFGIFPRYHFNILTGPRVSFTFRYKHPAGLYFVKLPNIRYYGKLWGIILRFFGYASLISANGKPIYVNFKSLLKHVVDSTTGENLESLGIAEARIQHYVKVIFKQNPAFINLPLAFEKASLRW